MDDSSLSTEALAEVDKLEAAILKGHKLDLLANQFIFDLLSVN